LYLVADRNVEVSESVSYGVFNSWLIPYRSLYLRSNVWELELMVPRFGQVHIETLRLRLVRY